MEWKETNRSQPLCTTRAHTNLEDVKLAQLPCGGGVLEQRVDKPVADVTGRGLSRVHSGSDEHNWLVARAGEGVVDPGWGVPGGGLLGTETRTGRVAVSWFRDCQDIHASSLDRSDKDISRKVWEVSSI